MNRQQRIFERLQTLGPARLEVVNDSARHVGHAGDNGTGESHFIITIAASALDSLNRVAAHRLIHAALADELAGGLHAITIKIEKSIATQS